MVGRRVSGDTGQGCLSFARVGWDRGRACSAGWPEVVGWLVFGWFLVPPPVLGWFGFADADGAGGGDGVLIAQG